MKKVLSFLGNVLIVAVLIVSVVMTVAIISSTKGEKARIPNLFGYALLTVQTDSMESDKGMFVGDLIVDKLLSEDEANDLHVGDVITFVRMDTEGNEFLETHRIVEHKADLEVPAPEEEIIDGIWTRSGDKYYTTRGDNTPDVDLDAATQRVEYVYKTSIVGMWTGIRIPKLGSIMDFLQTSMGFMVCIVIPVALFFIYQLYVFIMTLTRRQKEKALEEVSSKEEELKQKAIAEFLAQQQANGDAPAQPDTKPAEPEPESDGKKKRKSKKVKEEDQSEQAEAEKTEETAETDAADASIGEDGSADKETEEKAESAQDASNGEDGSAQDEAKETEEKPESEEKAESEKTDASNGEDKSGNKENAETEEKADTDGESASEAEPDEKPETDEKAETDEKTETESADTDHTPEISEEEKERIIREYLAKQAQESNPEA